MVEAFENGLGNFAKESRSEANFSKGKLSSIVGRGMIVRGHRRFNDLAKELDGELREGEFGGRRGNRGRRGRIRHLERAVSFRGDIDQLVILLCHT